MPQQLPYWLQYLNALSGVVGSVFGALAFVVAGWAAWKAIPAELEKFRATRREENRARVAETVWMAAYRFTLTLRALTNPSQYRFVPENEKPLSPGAAYRATHVEQMRILNDASNNLVEAWGLANLFLGSEVDAALSQLWKVRARILVGIDGHAENLDCGMQVNEDAWRWIYGDETKQQLDSIELTLRGLIEPLARLDGSTLAPAKVPPNA